MEINPQTVFNLLRTTPGNLVYYLILTYSIITCLLAVIEWLSEWTIPLPFKDPGWNCNPLSSFDSACCFDISEFFFRFRARMALSNSGTHFAFPVDDLDSLAMARPSSFNGIRQFRHCAFNSDSSNISYSCDTFSCKRACPLTLLKPISSGTL